MLAVHKAPQRTQNQGGLQGPVLTGIGIGALVAYRFNAQGDENFVFGGVLFGLFSGLVSIPFWWLANKTWLHIRFDGGAMSWRGPEKQWWRKRRHRAGLEEIHSLQVIAPHRWAAEEARKHDDYARRNPGLSRKKPLFQTLSELILHTGPEGVTGGPWLNLSTTRMANRQTGSCGPLAS